MALGAAVLLSRNSETYTVHLNHPEANGEPEQVLETSSMTERAVEGGYAARLLALAAGRPLPCSRTRSWHLGPSVPLPFPAAVLVETLLSFQGPSPECSSLWKLTLLVKNKFSSVDFPSP